MNNIVKASGISKGGIYVYLKSKDEIFLAIADHVTQIRHGYIEDFPTGKGYTAKLRHYRQSHFTPTHCLKTHTNQVRL